VRPAVLWSRWDPTPTRDHPDGRWAFNHLDDRPEHQEPGDRPAPKTDEHRRVWAAGRWRAERVQLDPDNVVIHQETT
jgi:hypothetical protein